MIRLCKEGPRENVQTDVVGDAANGNRFIKSGDVQRTLSVFPLQLLSLLFRLLAPWQPG
jgi:hypothetical protein